MGFTPEAMIEEIKRVKPKVVRIHVAGDFYSVEYTMQWIQVVRACPEVTFFAYTRSWTVGLDPDGYATGDEKLYRALCRLAFYKNMTLWLSHDASMPKEWTKHDASCADREGSWGYKIATIDRSWTPRTRKVIDCPEQTGKAASCSTCKLCYSPKLREKKDYIINFLKH